MYRNSLVLEKIKCEDLYLQYENLIKDNICGIQKQSFNLRDYLLCQKKKIVEITRKQNDKDEPIELKTLLKLYDNVQKELISIEEDCNKFWVKMKLDLLLENKCRSELFLENDLFKSDEDNFVERCHCTWKNVFKSIRNDGRIRSDKLDFISTKFDNTDLKFKQDLMDLRTKVFHLVNDETKTTCQKIETENAILLTNKITYLEILKKYKKSSTDLNKIDLSQIHNLKYINGELIKNEGWSTVLDINGNQLRSKWYLVVSPQIEKILKKRRIYSLHLNPSRVFNLLLSIPESGIHFKLSKIDLIFLLENIDKEGLWLMSWKPQLKTFDKDEIAAILIQSRWRGYWLRKQLNESYRRYIAASVLWYKWLSVRDKRMMQRTYLEKMLTSLNVVRELNEKLMNELNDMIKQPHVIIHVPSIGYPVEIRRTFTPKMLAIYQHTMIFRLSFLRNQMSEIIYILPIDVTEDFLSMYFDIIDSVVKQENTANRITFLSLSQAKTLENTHMNVSRILHCSEDTLIAIKNKINEKPAYILPWIVDECDVRISGNLRIPLLGPDMMLQQRLLNLSKISEIIDDLGLPQPAHSKDIREYSKLCTKLAELILLNTDICLWLIKVNFGIQTKHCGVFLINHISIPFMHGIRETRKRYANEWLNNSHLREEYFNALSIHLLKVVSIVTNLNKVYYHSWKDFYNHVQKFGCILQAVPNEKNSSIVTSSLFVPNKITMKPIKWIGTSNKIQLDLNFSTFAYMIPQTSVNIEILNPSVNKLARALQQLGYFGYLTIDCYSYFDSNEEKMIVLLLDVHPYYSHLQQYVDWMKFVTDGSYNSMTDTFDANVIIKQYSKKRMTTLSLNDTEWNETTERAAIVIRDLYHENLPNYNWEKLKILMEDIGIIYEAARKEGCHFILHDSEYKNTGTMVLVTTNMKTTLFKTYNILRKLSQALSTKRKSETNMLGVAEFLEKFSINYHDLSRDPCK